MAFGRCIVYIFKKEGFFLEVAMIRWNEELAERLACPLEDKRLLYPLLESICDIAVKARQEGLLSLEPLTTEIHDEIFRVGMGMIVDGFPEDILEDVFAAYLHSFDETGYRFLKTVLIAEGLLSIQSGENPRMTRKKLAAYLGDEAFAALNAEGE
jgi:flagellar motor component MotA